MKNADLKKLALMGITGGIIVITNSGNADQNENPISQGYSNQGYFYNREGRESSNYYYQIPKKRQSRSDQDQNNGQQNDDQGNPSSGRNSDRQGQQYRDRGQVADKDETENYQETPPDNIHEKPDVDGKFLLKLNPKERADYQQLSERGKTLARNIAAHDCAGRNDCKGQNACKSDLNACAGKGSCKGKSICKVTPGQAVKLASLLEKRQNLQNNSAPNSSLGR